MIRILVALLAVLVAGPVAAQTGALVSVDVQIYAPGVNPATGNPVQTNTFLFASAVCNQAAAPPVAGPVFNPTKVEFDDRANPGRVCVADQGAFLAALPIVPGDYTATLSVTDDRGLVSPRSAASNPFARVAPPAVLTGARVRR
jgi:hypothetical protein